ncbi:nitrate- and nitrite sensing domain-containing protein [Streptomyces sp. NPDC002514]|uniref:sensor histidine kinase n=1 Tax=Streptomyces sp. NPDC001270 TaxID=3364554 RepID=UPI0036BF1DA5
MQGRFKRDGSAPAEPGPHGGTDRGSSPQHAQNPGPTPAGDGPERPGRPGVTPPSNPKPAAKPAKGPSGPGSRIALRNWRISTRLVSLLALPVVAATTLGGLRINQSMDDIQQLDNMKLLTDMTKQATELAAALQEERDQSAGPLANGQSANNYTVKGYEQRTDRALTNFLNASEQIDSASKDGNLTGVRDSLVGLAGQLDSLAKVRRTAYQQKGNSTQTVEAYHRLITQLIDLSQDMAEASSNPEMIQRTRALAAFSTAKEYASVQRAVIAAALPDTNKTVGALSDNDRLYGESALESESSELNIFRSLYSGQGAEELLKPIDEGNPTIESADTYAKRALGGEDGLSVQKRSYRDWVDDSSTKIEQMQKIEHTLLEEMEQKARELRSATERDAIISGALILLVLGVSLVGAFVVARSMIRSLRRLQDTATKVAQDRLPELVKQLSESDPQDVDTSVESVGVHSRDEIGKVAAAFDDVHREAVRLAAEQALLRGNVNAMFTNLSRRSQGLIQRQLSLISELESREADPDQLSSLFKLDHLATRMRRNGENLLVLAGEEPGRRWTRPVPLVDVLRAAASEVEQYERIELASVPTTEVAGRVVNDLVHLLAELLENATSFSSPQTKVKVTGHALPDGRVLIEIHDTGIGLSPEDLAAINERLASPPTVDVSVSRRMGLFVVGRLSQRHGIRIQLRPSDSGGTTALVMLPVDVAQGGKAPAGKPGVPATGGPAAAQAAAGAAAARRNAAQGGGGALGAGAPAGALGPGAASAGGRLGAGSGPRGQVGAGQGPRAALPGTGQGALPGGPGGAGGPRQDRPAPAGAGAGAFGGQAPGAPQGLRAAGTGGPQQDVFGGRGAAPQRGGAGQGRQPQLPPRGGPRAELPGGNPQPRTPGWDEGVPPLSRASLDAPRGHDEQDPAQTSRMPRVDDRQGPGATAEMPAVPAADASQDPAATGEFPRPDFTGANGAQNTGQFTHAGFDTPQRDSGQFPRPGGPGPQGSGQFVRSDVFGGPIGQQNPSTTGQFPAPGYDNGSTGQFPAPGYDNGSTGQFPAPGHDNSSTGQFAAPGYDNAPTGQFPAPGHDNSSTGQFPAPGYDNAPTGQFPAPGHDNGPTGRHSLPTRPGQPQGQQHPGQFEQPQANGRGADFGAPRPPVPAQRGPRQEPEALLPPANTPGDGRTPLYDTLETNWFRGGQQERPQDGGPADPAPQQQPQGEPAFPGDPQRPVTSSWRSSPNDELVRQAQRVRQPAAGGVTTSGLPRRVPRANLVAGTAQEQQQHHSGPQVSRAPDDVRGRLTNLRRGIAQGRQANNGQTGSFPSPTHQQER